MMISRSTTAGLIGVVFGLTMTSAATAADLGAPRGSMKDSGYSEP